MLRAGFEAVLARLDQLSERIAALEEAIRPAPRTGFRPPSPNPNVPPSSGELLSHDPFGVALPPMEPPPSPSSVPDTDMARRVWTGSEEEELGEAESQEA